MNRSEIFDLLNLACADFCLYFVSRIVESVNPESLSVCRHGGDQNVVNLYLRAVQVDDESMFHPLVSLGPP